LRLDWVDDSPGVDRGVVAQDLDFARFEIDLDLGAAGGLVPVHRANALAGFGIESAFGLEYAIAQEVSAPRTAHQVGYCKPAIRAAAHAHHAATHLEVRSTGLQAVGAEVQQLLADISHRRADSAAHRIRRAARAGLLIVRGDIGVDVGDRHALDSHAQRLGR